MMSLPAALADDFAASITRKAPDSGVRAERSLTMVLVLQPDQYVC
jgi:hypothetical protein